MHRLLHSLRCVCVSSLFLSVVFWGHAQTDGNGRAGGNGAAVQKDTEGSRKLWGALVYAVKDADAKREGYKDADPEMQTALEKVFKDYKHFQVLGSRAEALFKSTHSWVAPSKQLCVKFDFNGLTEDGEGVKLDLQLWNQGKAIVKTDAILKPGSPVYMVGPEWGAGRLLYVLKLQEGGSDKPLD